MALDVGKIFYAEKKVIAYSTLGIGRLIYQLPVNLCKIFIEAFLQGGVLNIPGPPDIFYIKPPQMRSIM